MVDFLKANPFVSMEDYKWKLNPRMIRIMCVDNTRIHYLSEEEADMKSAVKLDENSEQSFSDLGIPIFK